MLSFSPAERPAFSSLWHINIHHAAPASTTFLRAWLVNTVLALRGRMSRRARRAARLLVSIFEVLEANSSVPQPDITQCTTSTLARTSITSLLSEIVQSTQNDDIVLSIIVKS
jgi:hypothetical protein